MPLQWDSVRYGEWKLIKKNVPGIEMRKHVSGAYEHLLFNMEKDPQETVNRWQAEMIVGKTLLQMLRWRLYVDEELQGQMPDFVDLDSLDDEVIENMKALGYL